MAEGFIPLSVPNMGEEEVRLAADAVATGWVSSGGAQVGAFEEALARYVGAEGAVAVASGTAGLHLAMLAAGIGAGDEVIVPALTFIAAVNPVRYVGAQPVFIGCDDSLCLRPQAVEAFCRDRCEMRNGVLHNKLSGRPVRALLVVHVFGNLADLAELQKTARRYNLLLIEDATEALGSYYTTGPLRGRYTGTIGDVGVYSFNGNKIITTGSGGMLTAPSAALRARAKHLSTQAKTDEVQFYHDEVGYNYRLPNVAAAIGVAQLARLEGFIARKEQLYRRYAESLGAGGLSLLPFRVGTRPNYWFFSLLLPEGGPRGRDEWIDALTAEGIQTRPVWALVNEQLPYRSCEAYALEEAEYYRGHIINLPCSTNLTDEEQQRVIEAVLRLGNH